MAGLVPRILVSATMRKDQRRESQVRGTRNPAAGSQVRRQRSTGNGMTLHGWNGFGTRGRLHPSSIDERFQEPQGLAEGSDAGAGYSSGGMQDSRFEPKRDANADDQCGNVSPNEYRGEPRTAHSARSVSLSAHVSQFCD